LTGASPTSWIGITANPPGEMRKPLPYSCNHLPEHSPKSVPLLGPGHKQHINKELKDILLRHPSLPPISPVLPVQLTPDGAIPPHLRSLHFRTSCASLRFLIMVMSSCLPWSFIPLEIIGTISDQYYAVELSSYEHHTASNLRFVTLHGGSAGCLLFAPGN